ncbi:MAG TPA: hypothetical protein VNW97_11660 [Candidatus Saccharimonadales bacterium]|jgi:hypothetical protein|nr:hypothetical protein [Candidatus Saccharimonadales bacterium]
MAAPHFNSEKKSHVYELLARLNASFARASRNLYELEKFGIFDGQMMPRIYNETKEAQASANHHLLRLFSRSSREIGRGLDALREGRERR